MPGAGASPVLDLGVIQGDGSLLTDGFSLPIPPEDYLVCRALTHPDAESVLTSAAGGHTHSVSIVRAGEAKLRAGDRVLVAWVGDDAVVIDVIAGAETLFYTHLR